MFCKADASKEVRDPEYNLRSQVRRLKEQEKGDAKYRIRNMNKEKQSSSGEGNLMNPDEYQETRIIDQSKETDC